MKTYTPLILSLLLSLLISFSLVDNSIAVEGLSEKCARLKSDIDTRDDELQKIAPKVNIVKMKLDDLAACLKNSKDTIDLYNKKAVAIYNEHITQYSTKALRYKLLEEMFNKKVKAYNKLVSQYNKECGK